MESSAKQSTELADLRSQLQTNLVAEFQQALVSTKAFNENQREALSKLVMDCNVTSKTILKALTPTKKDGANE